MLRTAVGDIFGSAVKTRRQKCRVGRTAIAHTGWPLRRSLFLELLEDRRVLSTFAVLNTNDSGAGSLRQAIVDANANFGADTIQFGSRVSGTIRLTSGQLAITDAVDLQGPGAGVIAVSGNNATLVFHVSANATIRGLTISGGSSGSGGGIYNSSTVSIVRSTISGNLASDGGGLANVNFSVATSASLLLATLSGNSASNRGGGIFSDVGTTTLIVDSTIALNGAAASGGGIFRQGAVTIGGSILATNTVGTTGPDITGVLNWLNFFPSTLKRSR